MSEIELNLVKTSKVAVTHTIPALSKLKCMVLDHVLMTRDMRAVPNRQTLPKYSDDDLIDNYFARQAGATTNDDIVVEQHGDMCLIDIGHYGVRTSPSASKKDFYAKTMRANPCFKKFQLICDRSNNLGSSASIYTLIDSQLTQMTIILEDTQAGKMWLFDHVHVDLDQLITELYDRICTWLHKHQLIAPSVYLTIQFSDIDHHASQAPSS